MTLVKYNPFGEIEKAFKDFEKYFVDVFQTPEKSYLPKIDVYEKDGFLNFDVEVPGFNKEDIKVTLQDNVLSITGERKEEKEEKDKKYYVCERSYGAFSRSFTLGDDVNKDNIDASYENGVLKIKLAKIEPVKPEVKQIEIK
ncbi:MAG TPA: Hsp20/alpha crystallin family protein [Ignavibacteriales bacterium]|nr:Hsp20/alpha crystallin family protein [Ignavibacteriales bacterium]HOL81895.1 Hsp20/alpha crystallin family protein [Ignavibacteriales bacterium]HOM65981.1 Hsp20/alpha crystallin family protein [Ignavibacteriales bacterium]HPD67513.1 Hsp20/alpha crystallin family protein [Ignavibacteriales bacterium]HPP34032.1 Hsp20/alpha crystallin family protein [Ignavibacteriales bacterium]